MYLIRIFYFQVDTVPKLFHSRNHSHFRDDWYGMLYSWADTKKKSSLMISILEPGQPFCWCGNLQRLGKFHLEIIQFSIEF